MSESFEYIFHGTKIKATALQRFILHWIKVNQKVETEGQRKTPLCIWGRHGIGKTEIIESLAKEQGMAFAYIAPAQFEEMGDLIGMPMIEQGQTVFQAPKWVPTEEGPGILLIDDINRADDRILRGLMQLLQYHELTSWKLPHNWQIICTANPDGGDYSVTTLDNAMLTRMMHVSLEFDVKEWAKWAEKHFIDPRGINFVLTYPEIITGEKTTARTLVQFFNAIADIEDLSANLELVQILGDACLEKATVSAFLAFVNQNLEHLIRPEEIIDSADFNQNVLPRLDEMVNRQTLRVDILSTICTRLVNFLTNRKEKLSLKQVENLKSFLKIPFMVNDLRYSLIKDLISLSDPNLKSLIADPEIGQLYMNKI